jgi:hypothetical protein
LQFFPHTDATSEAHAPSQAMLQQNGSTPQIAAVQLGFTGGLSQPAVSGPPGLQRVWEQAPALSAQVRLEQTLRTSETH